MALIRRSFFDRIENATIFVLCLMMAKTYKYMFTTFGSPKEVDGELVRDVLNRTTRYSQKDALSYLKGKGIKTSILPDHGARFEVGEQLLEFEKIRT